MKKQSKYDDPELRRSLRVSGSGLEEEGIEDEGKRLLASS